MPEDELLLEANKWELAHGGLSGRTAQQFIDYLLGKKERSLTGAQGDKTVVRDTVNREAVKRCPDTEDGN